MSGDLLQTKLFVPLLRPFLVPRPRLIAKLNKSLYGKLTLVCAPAGFGKTTLTADWATRLAELNSSQGTSPNWQLCWLSLDEQDNDPTRFLIYFIASLQTAWPQLGQEVSQLLQSPQAPPTEVLVTALINELTAVAHHFLLVLDDYHIISNQKIHNILAFLFEHQPPNLHLVLVTRADPLLPLTRLRARGELGELRQNDLRFDLDEATIFLTQVMELTLTPEQVQSLARQTEGWITGLQLAALSMQGQKDVAGFIASFASSNRFILEYLTDEVLRHRPQGTRDFLLQTAILDRLTGALCDAVTGKSNSQTILEQLEKAHLFITPLDSYGKWYRYHRLFSELLRLKLRTQGNIAETELHKRATKWYEANEYFHEAIHHALLGQDWTQAGKLIGELSDSMLKQGKLITVIEWCQKLPQDIFWSHPDLGLTFAWSLLLVGQYDRAETLLLAIESLAHNVPVLEGQVAAAQAYLARAKEDNTQVIAKSKQALALLPENDFISRGTLAMNLGLVYWHEGHLLEAKSSLVEAVALANRIGNKYAELASQIFLSRALASQGELRRSEAIYQQILRKNSQIPIVTLAYFDLCTIYYEWNQLEKADEYLAQGMALNAHSGNVEFQNAGHILRAMLLLAQGKTDAALAEVETSHTLADGLNPITKSRSAACHVLVALALADGETAVYWADQMSENADPHPFYRFLDLTRPRLLLAQGKREAAAAQLQHAYETAEQAGWGYALIAVRVWQALAAPNQTAALFFLRQALTLAQPEGYIRTFLDAGDVLVPLLQRALREGVTPDYTAQLLDNFGIPQAEFRISHHAKTHSSSSTLVDPLSQRELEILHLLAERQTNAEIAQVLTVSVNTVKTHLQHIYDKLGVHNRRTAVAIAQERHLL